MIRLIALTGKAHSGKSTLAAELNKRLRWPRFAFADPVKQTVNRLFNWGDLHSDGELKEVVDPKWGFSPRQAYQKFGTEFGRGLRPDLWIKWTENQMNAMQRCYPEIGGFIITDLRFEDEAGWVRDQGGLVVHVRRAGQFGIQTDHVSEKGVEFVAHKDYMTPECESVKELINEVNPINMIIRHDCSV